MMYLAVMGVVLGMLDFVLAETGRGVDHELRTVASVDLQRYSGTWYEIARYPNRFQRDCRSDTTAVYMLRGNGNIQVVNSCRRADGKIKAARGTAKVADKNTNAKLKVTFFWPFYGDYWIIGLSSDYRYAIVGEPKRKYLWILSRTPGMAAEDYAEALEQVRTAGYDPRTLIATPHSAASGKMGTESVPH